MAFRRSGRKPVESSGDSPSPETLALRLLARRSFTRTELAQRLVERGVARAEATRAAGEVADRFGLPADADVLRRWLSTLAESRGFGTRRLVLEAMKRGASRGEAERWVGELRSDDDDREALERELERMRSGMKQSAIEDGRARRRIGARLIRKGFSPSMVARALSSLEPAE